MRSPLEDIATILRSCEEALLDPGVRRDRDRARALLSEDFMEFGSSGQVWTRAEILDMMEREDYKPVAVRDFRCMLLSDSVALITYRAVRTTREEITASLRSSIWTKNDGSWRVRFHQGTRSR